MAQITTGKKVMKPSPKATVQNPGKPSTFVDTSVTRSTNSDQPRFSS